MIPQQYKNKVSKDSHWFYRKSPVFEHLNIIKKYSKIKTKKVLDAGCAEGKNTNEFYESGYDVLGVDYDKKLLSKAKKSLKFIKFEYGNIEKLSFESNRFDLVYCINTLFYTNMENSVRELLRITKAGGVLFCTFDCSIFDLDKGCKIHESNLRTLRKIISNLGEIKYLKKRQRKDQVPFPHVHRYYDVLIIKNR